MPRELIYWHKLETFIGRDEVVETILSKLRDGQFHLVTIQGGYGFGKTRLLEEVRKKVKRLRKDIALPRGIIDLYQTEYHSPEGLAQAIVDNFPEYDFYFAEYVDQKRERDEARLAGNVLDAQKANLEMLEACAKGLEKISRNHDLLLLLDTAERWVYPSIEDLPFRQNLAPAVDWFKGVCAALPRGMVLLAGREEIKSLNFNISEPLDLPAFSVDETRDYIRRIERKLNPIIGEPDNFSESEINIICELSDGRPILLALLLERIAHGDEQIRKAIEAKPKLESLIITRLMEDPQIGKILRMAGRAPRGVDLELLVEMSKVPVGANEIDDLSKVERAELKAGFTTLQGMLFAKHFRGSSRTFLHDEMYAMLGRYVYGDRGDDLEADQAAMGLYRYYKKHTEALNQEIGALYTKYAETNVDEEKKRLWAEIQTVVTELKKLDTDFVYYRHRRIAKHGEDPIEMGLRRYYRLAHEAATSSDWELLVLLRIELIGLIKNLQEKERNGSIQPWLPFLRGLLLVQDIWERNVLGQTQDALIDIETRMLPSVGQITGLSPEQGSVLNGLLKTWRGMFLLYSREAANYQAAEREFQDAILAVQDIPESSNLYWLASSTMALSYRQRAYLHKRQGHLDAAISDYLEASLANRWLDYNYEEATIRNDLGDTQVLTGALEDASLNLQDAFALRQTLKNGARLALSYSTLSRYFTADGAYEDARNHATRGVNLSSMVGRGTAFARLALAEATRRYATQQYEASIQDQRNLLTQAEQAALQALDGLKEPVLTIDVKLELGCIYRDRMRTQSGAKRQEDFDKANDLLLEVKELAGTQNPPIEYKMADAMANRIWLGLFVPNKEFIRQVALEFAQMDIFGFDINQQGALVRESEQMAQNPSKKPLLQFIGKYHAGLGFLELAKDRKPRPEKMDDLAYHWMLGLEYSAKFASRFRGLDAARKSIHKSIKTFNRQELIWLSQAVVRAEQSEGLKNSLLKSLMQQNSFWIKS